MAPSTKQSFIRRGKSFFTRLGWMSHLAGGLYRGARILVRISRDRDAEHCVTYGGHPVRFRGTDEQALREVFVDQEYGFLTGLLSGMANPKILDVGAHIGTFAIWALSVQPNARILSVEADPQTYCLTWLNAHKFAQGDADWQTVNAAAGTTDGQRLRFSDAGPSMSHRVDPGGSVEVESVSLVTLLNRIDSNEGPVDLVKIDIEGSEEDFICQAPDNLERIRVLVIELHPQLCDTGRVHRLLKDYFCTIYSISGRGSNKPLLYCQQNRFETIWSR